MRYNDVVIKGAAPNAAKEQLVENMAIKNECAYCAYCYYTVKFYNNGKEHGQLKFDDLANAITAFTETCERLKQLNRSYFVALGKHEDFTYKEIDFACETL